MASIRKRTWTSKGASKTAWVFDGVDSTGARDRKQFPTKAAAVSYRDNTLTELREGTYRKDAKKISIAELAQQYLKNCEGRCERGEHLTHNYLFSIRGHLLNYITATKSTKAHPYAKPFHEGIGGLRLNQITKKTLGEFRDRLRSAGLSVATTRKVLNTARTMFEYAIDQDYLSVNPARKVRVLSHRDEEKTVKRNAPAKWLVAALIAEAQSIREKKKRARLTAQIMLAAASGIRSSEAVGLRWKHLSFQKHEISIETRVDSGKREDGYVKSRASRRVIPLGADMLRVLSEWRALSDFTAADDFIFANRYGKSHNHDYLRRRQFYPLFAKLSRAYAADPSAFDGKPGRFTWHELRHFAISTWIAAGVPIKTIMTWAGHSTIQMTMDRYGHMFKTDQDWSTMDRLSEALVASHKVA